MGDRCWFEVYVRKKDARQFRKLVVPHSRVEASSLNPDYTNAFYFEDDQADYGNYTECQESAKRGLVFEGRSEAGCEYGPARFCAIDGKFYHIDTLWNGSPAIPYREQSRDVDPGALSAVHDYLDAFERVRVALGAKRRRNR